MFVPEKVNSFIVKNTTGTEFIYKCTLQNNIYVRSTTDNEYVVFYGFFIETSTVLY